MNEYAKKMPETDFRFEYSPESFTGTEIDFAEAICNAVIDIWQPTPEKKVIINLPATVSMSMPHIYAAQIAYMSHHLHRRDSVVLSLHPHNDRGTAVADAELGLLAGGDRIEGTLFGNGERTGNVDIVTLAMNLFSHGVDPKLDFSDMPKVVEAYEKYTDMKVHPRQPYGGQLVFAAFSGSHQDAIAKGMKYRSERHMHRWMVPYLPIDPHDVGREYEADVIRINSQSGKGGIAYILEQNYGFRIPMKMREEIGYMIKGVSDRGHKELKPADVYEAFRMEYINVFDPVDITDATFRKNSTYKGDDGYTVDIRVHIAGTEYNFTASGNGRLDAVSNALRQSKLYSFDYTFVTYEEHALEAESNSRAAAYALYGFKVAFNRLGLLPDCETYVDPDHFAPAVGQGPLPQNPEEMLAYICDNVCKQRIPGRTDEQLDAICEKCAVDRLYQEADSRQLRARETALGELNALITQFNESTLPLTANCLRFGASQYLRALQVVGFLTEKEVIDFDAQIWHGSPDDDNGPYHPGEPGPCPYSAGALAKGATE